MKSFIYILLLIFMRLNISAAMPLDCYKNMRNQILKYEKQLTFGGNLTLDAMEESANEVLMEAKNMEIQTGFKNPSLYPPGRNFLLSRKDIEKSEVFKKILRMPKGALLHAHDTAFVSADYIYYNVTYRDNLYVCDANDSLRLQFFDKPNKECNWELLSKVRQDPARAKDVNARIMQRLSMVCESPAVMYSDVNKAWIKFMDIFAFITTILRYKPVYEDHFYRGLEELYEDNVIYLELRSTLEELYDLDGRVYKKRDVVGIYESVTQRFINDHPDFVGVKLIYAPLRFVNRDKAREYIKTVTELKEEFPKFIAGFDLVGQEDKGNTLQYFADIMIDVDPKINFFFHAGETNWYGMATDENLVDAILLNTRRIGHGYALAYHPFLLEIVKRMNIAIEVNPISNQVLSLVGDLRNHAARRLFAEGYPVVVSNDDPGLWGARALSYDFYEAFMALMSAHSDLRALKLLAQNSLSYSSMTDREKDYAFAVWRKRWNAFVKSMANREF